MFANEGLWWCLAAGSIVMFVGSLVVIPPIVIRLPADYFDHPRRHLARPIGGRLALDYFLRILKNLAGAVFVVMGIAMLVLPGQGLLAILIGLSLINFPGKYRLERFIVSRPPVLHSMNWIRSRAGKPPLVITSARGKASADVRKSGPLTSAADDSGAEQSAAERAAAGGSSKRSSAKKQPPVDVTS